MKRILALLAAVMMMISCCTALADSEPTGVEDGVFTIAMERAYAPYNWTQTDDSNGAVPIKDSSDYANGYDVMIAKKICEANGWQLERSALRLGFAGACGSDRHDRRRYRRPVHDRRSFRTG